MRLPTLTTLLTLALSATATAIPTGELDTRAVVAAAAKCKSDIHHYQGGGCEWKWGGDCIQRCRDKSAGQKCCPDTVTSHEDSSGCTWGWQTCECNCKQKK